MKRITGKVIFVELGSGFWGIKATNGQKYRPINMPKHLKEDGKSVSVKIKEVENEVSIFMWGTPVQIV